MAVAKFGSNLLRIGGGGVIQIGASAGLNFPNGYDDPIFTDMTNLSPIPLHAPSAGATINNKQVANDASGDETLRLNGSCTFNYLRMVTREGAHFGDNTYNFNWMYLENYNVDPDHSDGFQHIETGAGCTVNVKNSHFRVTNNGFTGYFASDASRATISLEDVLFSSDGTGGNGLVLYDDIGSGAIQLSCRRVYFQKEEDWTASPLIINRSDTTNPVTVTLWEDVYEVDWNHATGEMTILGAIPQPSGT